MKSQYTQSILPTVLVAVCAVSACTAILGCTQNAADDAHDHGHQASDEPFTPPDSGDHDHDHGHELEHDSDTHDHADGSDGHTAESEGHDHDHNADARAEEGHSEEVTLTPDAVERYGVTIRIAELTVLRPTVVSPARVAFNADAMAHVGSPLSGRVVDLNARLGGSVRKGDPLLVVESPELGEAQADFFQKRTAAQLAGPPIELAKVAWDRARGLFEQSQGVSLTEVQKREAEYKVAIAAQRAAEAAAIGAENRLHLLGMAQAAIAELAETGEIAPRYTIYAPIQGQIVEREVTLGELVGPDRDALMVIADTSTLWVMADVPEAWVHEVALDAPAWVTLGPSPRSNALRYEGKVGVISPMIDVATRTAAVRIEVPYTSLPIRPGMFAQVEIATSGLDADSVLPVIAVPVEAIQTVEGGPVVFVEVKGESNTFATRAVTIGKPVGGLIPVLDGLDGGEAYVAGGSFILKAELGKGSAAHEH